MMNNNFTDQIIADVTPDKLHLIYARLEDEERPHELIIGTARRAKKRMIIIHTTADNAEYFRNLIEKSI